MTNDFTDYESKIGVDPLDILHADRQKLVAELAPLKAKEMRLTQ